MSGRPSEKPKVFVVEDNIMVLEAWLDELADDCDVTGFEDVADFERRLINDPNFLDGVHTVITDYYFDDSDITGDMLGQLIKSKIPNIKVYLSSDGYSAKDKIPEGIDKIIGKTPVGFGLLNL